MEIDYDKIDEAVLALMWLTLHEERRAWKSFDWDVTDRLYQKGLIFDPANKTKSVVLTDEGLQKAEEFFKALFTRKP
jgi:preprotein translocase subunit SecA